MRFPHFSLTLPFICFQLPSTRFQSMSELPVCEQLFSM